MTEEQKQQILDQQKEEILGLTREKMQKEIIDWVMEEEDLWVLARILNPANSVGFEAEKIAETIAEETEVTPEEAVEMAEELL